MYAHDLMMWLHERLAERGTLEETRLRFEKLRGYDLLPRGREKAGVRLSNEHVANTLLAYVHPLPGFAGHASLVLGDLRPVGGPAASIRGAANLREAIASLIATRAHLDLVRATFSVEQDFNGDEYTASIQYRDAEKERTVSFVTKYAVTLSRPGAEETYNHNRLDSISAFQRAFGPRFFRDLSNFVDVTRELDKPLKTDWREYETEEERAEFHRRLGAKPSSRFLNLRVDASVTWPKEPTRMKFGGHNLVLFPRTKDNSHSISIDLSNERISEDDAQSLMNRLLSIMSWCDDRPSSLHEGWTGTPVPGPVSRQDRGAMSAAQWIFNRTVPTDARLLRCLAYYRDGLNAHSVGLVSHAVVSFFRVFETKYDDGKKVISWVNSVYGIDVPTDKDFEADRIVSGVSAGTYINLNCRIATAHAARNVPSDPDATEELRRLTNASAMIHRLARHFIETEYRLSTSYLSD